MKKSTIIPIILSGVILTISGCNKSTLTSTTPFSTQSSISNNVSTKETNPIQTYKSTESKSYSSTDYDSKTWSKTAGNTNGYDWIKMNVSQKRDIVKGVIATWERSGKTVEVNENWFIEGLDSFYGSSSTNSTNLAMAMSMIGTTGGVIN